MNATAALYPKYRADVDGLRALAVLAVVGYHAFPNLIPGGFIGVDIFFVISGYLISTVIFQNIHFNSFSFIDFYRRRIRRIFPALILVLVACYLFGWFVLLPHEYKQLGKHMASGATFISNFTLWGESGYFDNTAETKPLLHLWSLAIEEQFYIVWPFFIWGITKLRFNRLLILGVLLLTSLSLAIVGVEGDRVAAFYSPQTRIWELLVGALLAHLMLSQPSWFQRNQGSYLFLICASIGLLLIMTSLLLINRERDFPGAWALLPTVGTMLLIGAGPQAWPNQGLANVWLVRIGLISFPLYLWHWPLLSFARILEAQLPSIPIRIGMILFAFLLAYLTYFFIERPIRRGATGRFTASVLVLLLVVVGYIGYNCDARNGLEFRGSRIVNNDPLVDGQNMVPFVNDCGLPNDVKSQFTCLADARQPVKYALLGDSKALAVFRGIARTSSDHGRWLVIGSGRLTPLPIISNDPIYRDYQKGIELAVQAIADNKNIEYVVIAAATRALFQLKNDTDIEDLAATSRDTTVFNGVQAVLDKIKLTNKKIILIVDNPTLPHPEDCLIRTTSSKALNSLLNQTLNQRCQMPIERHLQLSKKYRELLVRLQQENIGSVEVFDTIPLLCNREKGVCEAQSKGKLLYSITDHISEYSANLVGQALNDYLARKP